MVRRLATAAAFAILGLGAWGCAASPRGTDAEAVVDTRRRLNVGAASLEMYNQAGVESRTVPVPAATVWPTLQGVYAQLEIPVTLIDPQAREFGNPAFSPRRVAGERLNSFIDCGTGMTGPLANQYDVDMAVVTRLEVVAPDTTRVTTVVDAFARSRTTSGNQVHCQSREVLEARIVALVAGRLGFGPVR